MNRLPLLLLALASCAALSPCHADTKAIASTPSASTLRAPTQTPAATPHSAASSLTRSALNPQPLPPGPPDPDRVRASKGSKAQKAQQVGIIIVGGAPAAQH
jgi:hypothetical protein